MLEDQEDRVGTEIRCRFTFDVSFRKRWKISPWWVALLVLGVPLMGMLALKPI